MKCRRCWSVDLVMESIILASGVEILVCHDCASAIEDYATRSPFEPDDDMVNDDPEGGTDECVAGVVDCCGGRPLDNEEDS